MSTPGAASNCIENETGRGWALDNADATDRIKPRRPYTPYNLFYLLERERVVQGDEPSSVKDIAFERECMVAERSGKRLEDDIPIPARYKNVFLLPMWYEPNLKEKRKHRKTHGKISFKDLTEIISKNWATIDAETKEYCTRVSDIGRKRYKEAIARYNASQKIIMLKKERAAVESAKEKRKEVCPKVECDSPPRLRKGKNPSTPDRILSLHAPIVTPPHSGRNGYSQNVPNTPASFYHYGPPPPMPPPMPHSQHPSHRPSHGQVPQWMPIYRHHQQHLQQPQQHHQPPPYAYHPLPAAQNMNNECRQMAIPTTNSQSEHCGGHALAHTADDGVLSKNINSCVVNEETIPDCRSCPHYSEERGMTHDEAMRICTLMGSPGKKCFQETPANDLLQNVMSFDFEDHHSLSTDHGDMNRDIGCDSLLDEVEAHGENFMNDQGAKHEGNMLDLSELLPLELGDGDAFPDLLLLS